MFGPKSGPTFSFANGLDPYRRAFSGMICIQTVCHRWYSLKNVLKKVNFENNLQTNSLDTDQVEFPVTRYMYVHVFLYVFAF